MTFPLESRLKRRGCKVVGAGFALPGIVTDDMWLLVARNLGWEKRQPHPVQRGAPAGCGGRQ